ncbi:GrpB family protein [Bacillus pacificus]
MGSTSVQGLGAKPLIDMMIGVTDLKVTETWIEALLKIGYEYVPKETPNWRFLERANGGQAPTIYMFIFIIVRSRQNNILFRDFLREHKWVQKEYRELKKLAATYPFDRASYTKRKRTVYSKNNKIS